MPVHIDEVNSEVTAFTGDLPLSEAQLEMLVRLVLSRLQQKERDAQRAREATMIRNYAAPQAPDGR